MDIPITPYHFTPQPRLLSIQSGEIPPARLMSTLQWLSPQLPLINTFRRLWHRPRKATENEVYKYIQGNWR